MKVVDVNVTLYAFNADSEFHPKVVTWWEAAYAGDESVGFTWITLYGFLRLSTHPRVFNQPISVNEALEHVDTWLQSPIGQIVQETDEHWRIMRQTVETVGTAGDLTTDAHLAALAISRGATVVSCDRDFSRFRGLRWENPLDSP